MKIAEIVFECAPYLFGFLTASCGMFIKWGRAISDVDAFDRWLADFERADRMASGGTGD